MKINSGKPFLRLNIKKCLKLYKADRYIGEFQIKDKTGNCSEIPVNVFYTENPDREKGHQNYFYLFRSTISGMLYIGGIPEFTEKLQFQLGIRCTECKQVVYSKYRHDFIYCKCGKASVDGGRDYIRTSGTIKIVIIDLLTQKVKE